MITLVGRAIIRKLSEMPSLVLRLIGDVETEVVEYKVAKQNYDFEDIGKYFSALSNEANLDDLDLVTVLLFDWLQKGLPITKGQSRLLHERKLVRGRYPKLTISTEVAAATGTHGDYVRAKGLDNSVFKELILELLRVRPCSRAEIIAELDHALPADLTSKQKGDHVSYLLQSLRKAGRITNEGSTSAAEWRIAD